MRQWENETPSGGLTEVYVYRPESKTIWPDDKLGTAFSQIDPRCSLPGNTGPAEYLHAFPVTSAPGGPGNSASQFKQVKYLVKIKRTEWGPPLFF